MWLPSRTCSNRRGSRCSWGVIIGRREWPCGDLGAGDADAREGGGGELSESNSHRVWRGWGGGGRRTRAAESGPWTSCVTSLVKPNNEFITPCPIAWSPDSGIRTSFSLHGQPTNPLGHSPPWPHSNQRVQSSLAHLSRRSTLKNQSPRRNPKLSNSQQPSEQPPITLTVSPAHHTSHQGPNPQNLQKQPSRRLPVLLVSKRSSRNAPRRNYDARPPLLHHSPAILLSSGQSSIPSNSQRPTALPLMMQLFQTLANQ